MPTLDEVLAHHGIKGMKWGVRRRSGSDGTVGGHTSGSSHDAERAKEYLSRAKSTGLHTLSNQELEHLTKRMDLEQKYIRVTSTGDKKQAGTKFAKELLQQVGKQQAARLASEAASKAIGAAMKKK